MIISSRIVLLHSPSGAGKTSLIQAAILPSFEDRGFQICGQRDSQFFSLRVSEPEPEIAVRNRYIYSAVFGLLGDRYPPAELAEMSLSVALDRLPEAGLQEPRQLLVVDQLEEILTLEPGDLEGQREFFRQLGEALDDDRRWGLLSIREDYMGGLDRFLRYVPGQLRATYRLDLLDEESARRAICEPAELRGVKMAEDAAITLVDGLRTVTAYEARRLMVDDDAVAAPPRKGPYVEPVLLQVVCNQMWNKLCKSSNGQFDTISMTDVEGLPIDKALRRYYADVVQEAADGVTHIEHVLRQWVADELITEDGFRSQRSAMPDVPDQQGAIKVLEDRHLIRSHQRTGTTWWELSHDLLIEPVIRDNATWRRKNLEPWQIAAIKWHRSHEDETYLLSGEDFQRARRWLASHAQIATDTERRFIERSGTKQDQDRRLLRTKRSLSLLGILLTVSISVNVALISWLIWGV